MSKSAHKHRKSRGLVFPAAGERREPAPRGDRSWPTAAGRPHGALPVGRPGARLSPELIDEAVDGGAGRRCVRQALGMPSERISDEPVDELLAGASTEEEIAGPGGLLAQLTKRLVEWAM
jgi:hypothetical protein